MQTNIRHWNHHGRTTVVCGLKHCQGVSAHCCTWDEDECCFLSWYTVWWIWVGAILLIVVAFSVLICCFRNNRRTSHHSARHMIVVHSPPPRYVYGSIGADMDQLPNGHHPAHGQQFVPNAAYKLALPSSPPPYIDMPQYKV